MPSTSPSLESRKLIFSLTELICWGLTPAFPPEKDVRLILQPYLLFSPSQPTRSRRPMPDSIKTLKQFYTSSLMARFVVFVSSSFMTSLLLLLSTFKRLPERGLDWCRPDKGWLKNGLGGLFYGHLVCTRQHLLGWDRSSEWTHPRWKAGIDADLFADNQNSWQEDTDLVNEPIIHAWRGREEGVASDLCRDQNLSICAAAWLLPTCKSFANWHPTAHSSHPTSFLQSRHSNDQPGSKHCKKRLNGSMFKCGPIYKSIDVSLWPNIEPYFSK